MTDFGLLLCLCIVLAANGEFSSKFKICLLLEQITDLIFKASLLEYTKQVERTYDVVYDSTSCDLVIEFVNVTDEKEIRFYPTQCNPKPYLEIKSSLFDSSNKLNKAYINECRIRNHIDASIVNSKRFLSNIVSPLDALIACKIMECFEQTRWKDIFTFKAITLSSTVQQILHYRQSVKAVIIWIGTQQNVDLISNQIRTIQASKYLLGSDIIIPWAATDSLYPCRRNTTDCIGKGNSRFKYLPQSTVNLRPEGWRCAQRRPLRSLAHVLALYDPQYIVLLDDDTFFNYPLFLQKFSSFLSGKMQRAPIIMGEFMGRIGESGDVSTRGILAGGSGYVLGKVLLDRLVSHEVIDFEAEDGSTNLKDVYRSVAHKKFLSIAREVFQRNKRTYKLCTKLSNQTAISNFATTCLSKNTHQDAPLVSEPRERFTQTLDGIQTLEQRRDFYFPTVARLIDVCTELMAGEHTCQHSDHSLPRCMLYGAGASPVGVFCHNAAPAMDVVPAHVRLGFCFSTPVCDPSVHVTCHRYQPSQENPLHPERVSGYKNTRLAYSSVFYGDIKNASHVK